MNVELCIVQDGTCSPSTYRRRGMCDRHYYTSRKEKVRHDRERPLPAQPILDLVAARGGMSELVGTDHQSKPVRRWRQSVRRMERDGWVSPYVADTFCVKVLRVHPAEVYGHTWWAGVSEPDAVAAAWLAGDLPMWAAA